MQQLESKTFTKAAIRSRLVRKAAELWGYQESDMDAFDPLVNLLIEANSVEFEKIANEITSTQFRVLDRLANLMNPDVVDIIKPSYGIMQAKAEETFCIVRPDAQFVYRKPTFSRNTENSSNNDFYFSPIFSHRLLRSQVKALVNDQNVYFTGGGNAKTSGPSSESRQIADYQSLWIGLEVDEEIQNLNNVSFFFDWQNDGLKDMFYQYLPLSRWYLGGLEIKTRVGLAVDDSQEAELIDDEFDALRKIERSVKYLYDKCFVTVLTTPKLATLKAKYPPQFESMYSAKDLGTFKEQLVWFEVRFPHSLPSEALQSIFCSVNAFPVLNRRMYKLTYKLQQQLNIIPMESEESFLSVNEVTNDQRKIFKPIPLVSIEELEVDTYILRQQGIGRFDTRDAKESLYYMLELLHDESRAFSAIGADFLSEIIRGLSQNIARLEQKLEQGTTSARSTVPYLIVKPKNVGENIYVEYWTTNGESANRIPGGSKLNLYSDFYIDRDEIYMLTTTVGGREKLKATDKVNSLKKDLLTRGRVVTIEDIKVVCWSEMGSRIKDVQIEKGFISGTTPSTGFVRCIKIVLVPMNYKSLSDEEWKQVCEELKATLDLKSPMNLPYVITVKK